MPANCLVHSYIPNLHALSCPPDGRQAPDPWPGPGPGRLCFLILATEATLYLCREMVTGSILRHTMKKHFSKNSSEVYKKRTK